MLHPNKTILQDFFVDNMPYGEITLGEDFRFDFKGDKSVDVDFLLFFDSRGSRIQGEIDDSESIYSKWKSYLDAHNFSYVMTSRPFGSTTFFSLINFVKASGINYKSLITNVGFVDLTPKKKDVIDDIILQAKSAIPKIDAELIELEEITLSSGSIEMLYSLRWETYVTMIAHFIETTFENSLFIETPVFGSEIQFERKRPESFFSQLHESQSFIRNIAKNISHSKVVALPEFEAKQFMDDGVHYIKDGHRYIWNCIRSEFFNDNQS